MDDLYKWIEEKCGEKGIKISKLCSDIGIRQSVLSDLKYGRTKGLSVKTAGKLANYFDVDIVDLLDFANAENSSGYYDGWKDARETYEIDPDLAKYLDILKNRPEMRMLFDVSKMQRKNSSRPLCALSKG